MAETRHRAEVTSRSRPDQSWDAGLHAESDQGPIDVGVSIESSALGLVVEAPGLGVLRLSFDVAPDGAAKLATASRTLDDGRKVAVIAVDETKVLQLQAANNRLDEQVALVVSERDEARHRAAALMEEKRAVEGHLETVEADHGVERERLTTTLQIERDQRLVALGEREKARAELERLRGELDAGSATLMREVNEARAARDASEAERGRVSRELTELSEQLQSRAADVEALQRAKKELEAGVQALEGQLTLVRAQHLAAESTGTERSSALEASQAAVTSLTQELASSRAQEASLTHELEGVRAQLADGASQLESTDAEAQTTRAQVASLTEELERVRAQLADGASQLEAASAETQSSQAQVASLTEELDGLRVQVGQLEAEREALNGQLSAKSDELALTSQALDDLQRDQARANAELQAFRADFDLQIARAQAETQDAREAQTLAEGRIATLEAAALESGTQLAELTTLQQALAEVNAQLDAERAQAAAQHAELQAQIDDAVSAAKEWDAALKSERIATSEAREVAKQLKVQFDKAAHERDEARAIARQLHQKAATSAKSPEDEANQKTLLIERDSLSMQVEALGRQLEQERTARARAMTERDEFRSRFKALTSSTPARSPEDSQETTRPYHIDALDLNATQRDMPNLRTEDLKTEPARGQVAPPKKKGP